MKDVCIIGAGVVGALIARKLSAYQLNICVLEKENDVGMGTTKANSAIIHAGFDAEVGTLKAKLNVLGSNMMKKIANELGVKYENNGAMVVGFNEADEKSISTLYQRGINAKVDMDKITNGAIVDQDRQTSIDGIFSCGNVLHVHDLVDYVSDEAEIAGQQAVAYLNGSLKKQTLVPIKTDGKVRYTVPQMITRKEDVSVYFRVANVYKNVQVCVCDGEKLIYSVKKAKVVPGEMQKILIKDAWLENVKELTLKIEEN